MNKYILIFIAILALSACGGGASKTKVHGAHPSGAVIDVEHEQEGENPKKDKEGPEGN